MSLAAKVSTWVCAATAVLGVLLAALTYGANRADSFTQAAVAHESRHVQTESDVEHLDESVGAQLKIIQAQYAAIFESNIIILTHVVKD